LTGNALEEVLRIEGARVLATLIRFTGDITLAEDALQDAVIIALQRWPSIGVPRNPAAWLTTAARHRALNRIRRESTRSVRERRSLLVGLSAHTDSQMLDDAIIGDDQLRLIFTCCHPALAVEQRIALALRTIGGLKTPEIARAFLTSDATMGQRISRAKAKIATAKIAYRIPEAHESPDRLPSVLQVVSTIFTAGHHAASGAVHSRIDLCREGIRLAELLVKFMPDEAECAGLLALLLATHARRIARLDDVGAAVLMADQDRSLWDHEAIARAGEIVEWALKRGRGGPYQIQAAIACLHGLAPTFADTDWAQISELYRLLEARQPTAVVRVNRSVAEAFAHTPGRGLALLDELPESDIAHWHLYWTTRAELLSRSGRSADATSAWKRALACDINDTDRSFIHSKLHSYLLDE
jgi:RNA polymerase sigma-70 factor, ECF subfamily